MKAKKRKRRAISLEPRGPRLTAPFRYRTGETKSVALRLHYKILDALDERREAERSSRSYFIECAVVERAKREGWMPPL